MRNSRFAIHTLALDDEGHNNDDDGDEDEDVNVLVNDAEDVSHIRKSADECLPFNGCDKSDRESDEAGKAFDGRSFLFAAIVVDGRGERRQWASSSCGSSESGEKRDIDFTDDGSSRITSTDQPLDSAVITDIPTHGHFTLFLLLAEHCLMSSGEW